MAQHRNTFAVCAISLCATTTWADAECPTGPWATIVSPAPQEHQVSLSRDLGDGRHYVEVQFGDSLGDWPKVWAAYLFDAGCLDTGVLLTLSVDPETETTLLPFATVKDGQYSVLAIYAEAPEPQEIWTRTMDALGLTTETIVNATDVPPPPLEF